MSSVMIRRLTATVTVKHRGNNVKVVLRDDDKDELVRRVDELVQAFEDKRGSILDGLLDFNGLPGNVD